MSSSRKVCSLDELLACRADAAARGLTVVHCHGCFDIVHPGHIQYLQFARSQGDLLIVSLTADPQVNKGPARPLIPEDLRAASVAALECVNHVYVNPDPTAVELLEQLRPDVYVKGREYETNNDPRFLAERRTVTAHGGRVIFSSGDVVYSSTALIGGGVENLELFNDEKIRRFRQQHGLTNAALAGFMRNFDGLRMVVVGDTILDRYHHCDATGVASEGPMMALRLLRSEDFDGGAAIVASHLAGLGIEPTLITALPDSAAAQQVENRLAASGVSVRALRHRRQIATKHRYLVDHQKMMKVDDGGVAPLDSQWSDQLIAAVLDVADGAAGVVFADFGYGLLTSGLLDRLLPALRPRVPIITADVSGMQSSLTRFKNVDLLCPTEREVRQTLNDFGRGLNAVVHDLLECTKAKSALITLGKQGLVAFDQMLPTGPGEAWERKLRGAYLPSLASQVIDPLGCGDALLAAASATLAAGGSLQAAAYLGSLAAAVEAQQLGNRPVSAEQISARMVEPWSVPQATRLAS